MIVFKGKRIEDQIQCTVGENTRMLWYNFGGSASKPPEKTCQSMNTQQCRSNLYSPGCYSCFWWIPNLFFRSLKLIHLLDDVPGFKHVDCLTTTSCVCFISLHWWMSCWNASLDRVDVSYKKGSTYMYVMLKNLPMIDTYVMLRICISVVDVQTPGRGSWCSS